jgi:hypothetical protein
MLRPTKRLETTDAGESRGRDFIGRREDGGQLFDYLVAAQLVM